MIAIQLPDGSRREYPAPLTVGDGPPASAPAWPKRPRHCVDGKRSTSHVISQDASLAIITEKDADGLT